MPVRRISYQRTPATGREPPGAMALEHYNESSNAFRFGVLWYAGPNAISNAVDYAKFRSRSHDAVIRVYDAAGNVIETHEHAGEFREW
jgi:hypothetical protein